MRVLCRAIRDPSPRSHLHVPAVEAASSGSWSGPSWPLSSSESHDFHREGERHGFPFLGDGHQDIGPETRKNGRASHSGGNCLVDFNQESVRALAHIVHPYSIATREIRKDRNNVIHAEVDGGNARGECRHRGERFQMSIVLYHVELL